MTAKFENPMHAQQSTRLQRRCYWLLESEDDIVLVHYLNIDKAKGKTEDTWAAPDSDLSRRPGFTVTSGGVHNIQVSRCLPVNCVPCGCVHATAIIPREPCKELPLDGLPHAGPRHTACWCSIARSPQALSFVAVPFLKSCSAVMQALPHAFHMQGQAHHMPVQPGLESYIPLMPSLSLDSFFASCDEREAAAQRAQQPPAMMENVLPAWGEDLNNGPGGSLQALTGRHATSSFSSLTSASVLQQCGWETKPGREGGHRTVAVVPCVSS